MPVFCYSRNSCDHLAIVIIPWFHHVVILSFCDLCAVAIRCYRCDFCNCLLFLWFAIVRFMWFYGFRVMWFCSFTDLLVASLLGVIYFISCYFVIFGDSVFCYEFFLFVVMIFWFCDYMWLRNDRNNQNINDRNTQESQKEYEIQQQP